MKTRWGPACLPNQRSRIALSYEQAGFSSTNIPTPQTVHTCALAMLSRLPSNVYGTSLCPLVSQFQHSASSAILTHRVHDRSTVNRYNISGFRSNLSLSHRRISIKVSTSSLTTACHRGSSHKRLCPQRCSRCQASRLARPSTVRTCRGTAAIDHTTPTK